MAPFVDTTPGLGFIVGVRKLYLTQDIPQVDLSIKQVALEIARRVRSGSESSSRHSCRECVALICRAMAASAPDEYCVQSIITVEVIIGNSGSSEGCCHYASLIRRRPPNILYTPCFIEPPACHVSDFRNSDSNGRAISPAIASPQAIWSSLLAVASRPSFLISRCSAEHSFPVQISLDL